jgi:hypothetical protein
VAEELNNCTSLRRLNQLEDRRRPKGCSTSRRYSPTENMPFHAATFLSFFHVDRAAVQDLIEALRSQNEIDSQSVDPRAIAEIRIVH